MKEKEKEEKKEEEESETGNTFHETKSKHNTEIPL